MLETTIKGIPANEEYLFAKKTILFDKQGLLQVPRQIKIKFVITNKAIYYKIAGVLIDTTGTMFIPLDNLKSVKKGKYLWATKLIITDKNLNELHLIDKQNVLDEIIKILSSYGVTVE